jgi:hypothetical protein
VNLKERLFLTPLEVCELFRHEGDLRWCYRHCRPGGKLAGAARRFERELLFSREDIEKLVQGVK